jgi:hypothetical protein
MISTLAFGLVLLPLLSAAYPVDPPSTASPDTIEDCTYWQVAADTDTCASISEYWGLTEAQFTAYVRLDHDETKRAHTNTSIRTPVYLMAANSS